MSLNYFDLNSVTIETRFAPWTHGHSIDAITGLRAELDATQSGLSSTSEIQFKTAEVFGNITPSSSSQYDLGSSNKHFKTAWIDELHLAQNTLYLGDTPVIGTNQDTVEIKADTDQNIALKTLGIGETKITSQNGVEISNSGLNGQIAIQSTGSGGTVSFGATSSINFTAPDANFSGDVEVTGHTVFNTATFTNDVIFQGDNITMDTTNFTAEDNRITLNSGEMGDGVTAGYAGFDIDRGNLVSWQFVFNEATDTFEYGPVGGTANVVVSKAYVDGVDALKLNSALYTAADVFSKVKSLDGSGSGLDADLLDGHEATFFIKTAQDYMDSIQTVDGTGSGLDADLLDGLHASHFAADSSTYNKTEVDSIAATKLNSSIYTAADVFSKVKSLDGAGSGLDADLLDGHSSSYFSAGTHDHDADYLGLHAKADDADKLDGHDSTYFAPQSTTYTKTEVDNIADDKLDSSAYTAADVLSKIKTVDGNGSGLDADSLDGHGHTYFATATHNHDTTYLGLSAKAADANKLDGHDSTYFAIAASTDTSSEVDAKIAALVDSSPAALNTLNELAAALGDDPNFATTVNNNIATKLDSSAYTAADVLAKIKTVDGSGSGLDADMLDGHSASYFLTTTAKAADANLLDGINSTSFLRSDTADTMYGALTIDNGTSTTLTVLSDDSGISEVSIHGTSQGTGSVFVGQSDSYGGGLFYNGDGTPTFATGEASDRISFYRRSSGVNSVVFDVSHSSDILDFTTTPTVAGQTIWHSGNDGSGSGLNADVLDGHDSTYFLSTTGKAADADKLDGHDSSYFLTTTGKAADANLLDGHDSTYFLTTTGKAADADKLDGYNSTYFVKNTGRLASSVDLDTFRTSGVYGIGNTPVNSPSGSSAYGVLLVEANSDVGKQTYSNYANSNSWTRSWSSSGATWHPWVQGVNAVTGIAANSDLLDGYHASYFSPSTHTHSSLYLGLTAKAADSNLLDGLDSTKFLRSDVTDTVTAVAGIKSQMYDARGSQLAITAGESAGQLTTANIGVTKKIWLGAEAGIKIVSSPDNWASGFAGRHETTLIDASGNAAFGNVVSATTFVENGSGLSLRYLGKTAKAADSNLLDGHDSTYFLTTTGKAADSEKVDGINGASLLRSDATDYQTNTIYTRGYLVAETDYRDRGIYGTYDSNKTQHIWSMGVAYKNSSTGANFGNIYGLAYKYNHNGTGHGIHVVNNGTAVTSLGTNIWTSGNVTCTTLYGRATSANYADLAEKYTIEGSAVAGQVILIGGKDTDCVISDEISSQAVLGVVSTNPGMMMNSELEDGTFIALKGRVPCQVFGKVKKGEPLVSYKNGMAISINHEFVVNQEKQGIIFGKSLESSDEIGVSTIEVVVL